MDNTEFRVLIKHCFLIGKSAKQAQEWLEKHYDTSAPSKTTVCRWFREFQFGRTDTADATRSGRPIEVTTAENIKKVHRMVLNDRKIKVREIAEELRIGYESVRNILRNDLQMKKLCARWVPHLLTIDQKQQRVDDSQRNLNLYQRNPQEFLRRFVTMDETWIHYYTPESNRSSEQWLEPSESRPKRPKVQKSAGKVLASVFWDAHGIIFIDYLEKGKTITGEYYATLLDQLSEEIKKKRPHMAKKKVLFHHDNAPSHSSVKAMAKLGELKFELVCHPPYSPDLAPSDYYLFPNLKRWLQGKKFSSNEEVIFENNAYFASLDSSYYKKGIEKLEQRWSQCIALEGVYVEN